MMGPNSIIFLHAKELSQPKGLIISLYVLKINGGKPSILSMYYTPNMGERRQTYLNDPLHSTLSNIVEGF